MNAAAKTHYDALGAPRTASHAELRRAYVGLARKFHPDFHIADPVAEQERAAALMRRINDAWSVLGDEDRRRAYDKSLGRSAAPAATASNGYSAASNGHSTSGATAGARAGSEPMREPSSGHTPSRWLVVLPAGLLAAAFVLFAVGFVTGLVGVLAAGVACAVLGGVAFVVVPMLTAMRARDERPV